MAATTYSLYFKPRGASDYRPVGPLPLDATPSRGKLIAFEHNGQAVRATVDAVVIPPGCEENCIGSVFAAER